GPRLSLCRPRGNAARGSPRADGDPRRGDHAREPGPNLPGSRGRGAPRAGRPPGPGVRAVTGSAGGLISAAPEAAGNGGILGNSMNPDSRSALWLSAEVAVAATALNALVGVPLAYLLARRRFPGRRAIDLLVTLPLILPPTVTGYYLIVLLGRRGLLGAPLYNATGWSIAFTPYAAVVAATVMALPLLVRTAQAAIESVDRDLERASFTLGRSEWRTALEVTLPLAR